jgi:Cof subfamily protein (haloacid dehalogenase superfamily)
VWTPRLVASDIDGTLLSPEEKVTPATFAAIAKVLAADVPFVLVSGRPPRWIPGVAEAAGVAGYAVCSNGAVLYDVASDRVLRARVLEPITLGDLVHGIGSALPGSAFAAERVGESASGLPDGEFVTEGEYSHPWPDVEANPVTRAELIGRPAIKLLVRHHGVTSDELAAAVRDLIGDAAEVTYSSNVGMLELSVPGITKASGLAEVADLAGVAAADVVAFGDMPNDVPMLAWAGLGVAMANAHPAAIAAADEQTTSNAEDGVAAVLARWF